ncbi:hypothetical protein [Paeniglutamicibacter psychrophenolicus]|uniref:hypothetical protein n=1 Tax=Paeniglutamicibacter psychrophenolicus TaxID=257454 RepID=UPI002780BB40|nr:hypothetical protein [Paeniglutamicibacter psychrophenolicus]MDQ0093491.1 tetratricopeptide (TPR) repeat protein [Paeniglutamicibacter psychrophenolicus]
MIGVGKQWSAHTGLHQLLYIEQDALRHSGFRNRHGTLEILLRPGVTARTLESAVRSASGGRGRGYWLVRGTSLGVGLAIGGATLLGLALIDLFNQLVGTAITNRLVSNGWHGWLLIATFLVGGAAVGFAPRLLSTDGGWARNMVMRWIDGEARALSRINRRLRTAAKHGLIKRVVVWNAFAPESLGMAGIIECLRGVPVAVELRIHHDEQAHASEFWTLLRAEPDRPRIVEANNTAEATGTIGPDPMQMLTEIAGSSAAWAFGTAIQHSSYSSSGAWRRAVDDSGAFNSAGIAHRLAAARFDQDAGQAVGVSDAVRGNTWMMRFIHDYRLFAADLIPGVLRTATGFPGGNPLRLHHETAMALEIRHPAHAHLPADLENDVAAVFATLLRTQQSDWDSTDFARLLNSYVHLAATQEHYRGIQVLAQLISKEFECPGDERRLLAMLDIRSLSAIQEPLSIAGHGPLAIRIARWIASFTGRRGVLQRSTLLERIGCYEEAYAELELLQDIAVADTELTEDYLRVRAWVLLSAGRNDPGWGPEIVRADLERLDLIYSSHDRVGTPELARQRENHWALLHEWEGNREAAIECHQRAVELPGLPLRRLLGSTINKGRCLRDLAVAPLLEAIAGAGQPGMDDWNAALDTLNEAGKIIAHGYQGKINIGDTDEAPIGAHNLALVQLYQAAVALRLGLKSEQPARAALATAREGLAILEATESTRKKSTLLAEAGLAERLLNGTGSSGMEALAGPMSSADQKNLDWVFVLADISRAEDHGTI